MSKEKHDERAAQGRAEQRDKPWIVECVRMLKPHVPRGGRVLDIGCGNGEVADILREEAGCRMTCLDYAPTHLERVRTKGHEVIQCNLDCDEDLRRVADAARGQFDAVTSLEVIEHLFNPDTLLQLAHSVLKPGGHMVISTPNLAYVGYRLYSMFRGNLPPGQGHHISFFSGHRLWQQMFVCGFDVEDIAHFGAGEFYLDRAIGQHSGWGRRQWIRVLFEAGLRLGPPSLRYSELVGLARKANALSLGLNRTTRDESYCRMSAHDRKMALARLMPLVRKGRFDEHPNFIHFCEEEWEKHGGLNTCSGVWKD